MTSDLTLFKPNQLIATIEQVQVSRLAKHLGNYFLKHAQEQLNFHSFTGNEFSVSIKDFNEMAGVASKDYKLIQKSLKALITPVTIRDEDPEDIKNGTKICYVALVSKIIVDSTTGLYTFKLEDEIIELLKRNQYFTQLNLIEFNDLESKHAIIIFEWLKRYETNPSGMPILSVDDLRGMTHTTSKSYDNFTNLKTYVLDIAVNEINEKTSYQVSYEAIKERAKTRPKVTKLRWTFERKAEPEQSNVSNTTQDISIHGRYAELATLYVSDGFCESEADFYKATYVADLNLLQWFYEAKKHLQKAKNKLNKYLLADIEKGSKNGRWQSQRDVYQALFARLSAKDQAFMLEKQATQGFYEQILIMKKHLGDVTAIKDPEKWL